MKRLFLAVSVSMMVILGFAALSWAGEASVFDDAQGIIIRANTAPGATSGMYSVFLEVRGTDGNLLSTSTVTVTGLTPTPPPSNKNIPVPPAPTGPPYTAEYIIHNNTVASPDISLSYDNTFHAAYIFCTDSVGLMVMKYDITALLPAPGACGTANNGTFGSAPSGTSLCSSGTVITAPTGAGPWSWVCAGINGSTTNSPTCSASAYIPGACGTANNGTFGSAPSGTSLCSSGTVITAPTGAGPWSWVCASPNGGANSPTCSAQSTAALPDLAIISFSGPGAIPNNGSFNTYITVKNNGLGAAGPFNIKIYWNAYWKSMTQPTLSGQVRVTNGLAAGASQSFIIPTRTSGLVTHESYYLWGWVDADLEVTETDDNNNQIYEGFSCL